MMHKTQNNKLICGGDIEIHGLWLIIITVGHLVNFPPQLRPIFSLVLWVEVRVVWNICILTCVSSISKCTQFPICLYGPLLQRIHLRKNIAFPEWLLVHLHRRNRDLSQNAAFSIRQKASGCGIRSNTQASL